MSFISFDRLNIKPQHRPEIKPYYHDQIIAYDTETIKGKARLICDSKGNHINPENLTDCLLFLTRKKYRSMLGWFFNINHDLESILKWLDEKSVREFSKTNELTINMDNPIHLKYIPGKMVRIIRNKHNFLYFDIGNFLHGKLDALGEKYLGIKKLDSGVKDWSKVTMKYMRSKKAINYCIRDAEITEGLSKMFMNTCNTFGLFSKNYCSPASIATNYFMTKVEIPTLSQITKGRPLRSKLAYESYKGGFVSTFKKGYFERVYLYDINSAYPYNMTKLPNLLKGRFVFRMKNIQDDATMGWLRCYVTTPENKRKIFDPCYFSPLPVSIKKFNKNFYLAGRIKTTITLHEYHALKNDFDIEPIEGIYWVPDEMEYIFKKETEYLYSEKNKYKNGDKNIYQLLKIILNGFYGKTIQKIPIAESKEFNTGNLFNPFYGSYITAMCRIQAYELVKKYGPQNVIAIMTDGVAFDKKIDVPLSKKLGEWSLDMKGEGVFIGSGLYSIKDDTGKIKTATRGFRLTNKYDFFRLLAENADELKIKLPQTVRLSYKESLRIKKFDQWNIIQQGIKNININCDNKRIWQREFKNCADVLNSVIDSQPIFVNM